MYKLTNRNAVIRLVDGAVIPLSDDNTDYKSYKAWLEDGNIPEPSQLEPTIDPIALSARVNRDSELARADIQLLKVQDGVTGIGTQKAWREYRNALRGWPETENFPEVMPVAPDAK